MAQCPAVVVASEALDAGYRLWLRPESPADCRACAEGRGCGGGLLAQALRRQAETLCIISAQPYAQGQTVLLEVPDEALLRGSLRFYLLPLLALILAAGLAQALGLSDPWVILAGLFGLAAAGLFLALNSRRHGHNLLPITLVSAGTGPVGTCPSAQNKSSMSSN
ncbi:MAG: SoxR reducing system RseC family protein [Gammaproteobacteria bacterium]|nr:SoxR reducing system RseC family protein [Gammaproteobacteria bacterium]